MNGIKNSAQGYVLFEVVLALMIFAVAVLGLAQSLNSSLETATMLNRENAIRSGLRSFIEETRRKQIADMATEARDERLDVTFSSTVEELSIKNVDGTVLTDLYVLHAKASYGQDKDTHEETVDLYLYKPPVKETTTPDSGSTGTGSGAGSSGSTNAGAAAAPGGGGNNKESRQESREGSRNSSPGGAQGGAQGGAPASNTPTRIGK